MFNSLLPNHHFLSLKPNVFKHRKGTLFECLRIWFGEFGGRSKLINTTEISDPAMQNTASESIDVPVAWTTLFEALLKSSPDLLYYISESKNFTILINKQRMIFACIIFLDVLTS